MGTPCRMKGIARFRDLVTRSRSCTGFEPDQKIAKEELVALVELACYVPFRDNRQPLRYIAVSDAGLMQGVTGCFSFDETLPGCSPGVDIGLPSACIILLGETGEIKDAVACQSGIAAQTILLGAHAAGYAALLCEPQDPLRMVDLLDVSAVYVPLLAIMLGSSRETVVIDAVSSTVPLAPYLDKHGIRHVPKLAVEEVLLKIC